ncbi:MAG: glyoxalase III HchA, partial [Flavobacteriaceae bacterium]
EPDGSYSPSKLALKLATAEKTDFENTSYSKYKGKKSKILVIFTEQKNMEMQNGKAFSTGNHPVETLVPMLHLQNAGFDFEIATPTGKPVVLEMWAFPKKDEHVTRIYKELKDRFEKPVALGDFYKTTAKEVSSYAAVFIPGGHGALLGIPEDENVGKTLRWAHENDLFTISICHGPGALFSTTLKNQKFLYEGYKMAVFPDSVDNQTPMIGYLPGKMKQKLSERLKEHGAIVVNKKSDNTVCADRKLLTGASPLASNALGKLAATTLLASLKS